MLKKIDCIMLRVNDVAEALNFYSDVFGLKPVWQDERSGQAGLLFTDSDAEIVLHTDPNVSGLVEVRYLVDDVLAAIERYTAQGCKVLVEPVDIRLGRYAVIEDPFGTRLSIVDKSRSEAERDLMQG